MLKRACLALLLSLLLGACAPVAPTPTPTVSPTAVPTVAPTVPPSPTPTLAPTMDPVTLQILFIGNSQTYTNDLPKMFARLARSGGHVADVDMTAKPGYLLKEHVVDPDTLKKLGGAEWDIVVLQENSNIPRDESRVGDYMYPAARTLGQMVKDQGARTILYMTWAEPWYVFTDELDNFLAEQVRVSAVHRTIALELGADVAPVGDAFARSLQKRPDLPFWQNDKIHPNYRGTYMAACVFYALIYQQSPEGLSYKAGLSDDTAQVLQSVAAETVLGD